MGVLSCRSRRRGTVAVPLAGKRLQESNLGEPVITAAMVAGKSLQLDCKLGKPGQVFGHLDKISLKAVDREGGESVETVGVSGIE